MDDESLRLRCLELCDGHVGQAERAYDFVRGVRSRSAATPTEEWSVSVDLGNVGHAYVFANERHARAYFRYEIAESPNAVDIELRCNGEVIDSLASMRPSPPADTNVAALRAD